MRITLIQMAVADDDVTANVARADTFIRSSVLSNVVEGATSSPVQEQPHVLLLPELWTTGYAHNAWADTADQETPIVMARLAALSAELGVIIGGTMITRREDGELVNRFSLVTPDGLPPVTYDKSHLFPPMREPEFLTPGTVRVHTTVGETPAALSICYDLRFPGMYRASANNGAELFLVASAWPEPRGAALRTLALARALENQACLVLCNRVGPAADGTHFCGGSMVVSPTGEILLDLGHDERIGTIEVPIHEVYAARTRLPVLSSEVVGVDW